METQEVNAFGNPIRERHQHKFEAPINSLQGASSPRDILANLAKGIAPDYHQPIYDENPELTQGKDFRCLDLIDIQNAKREYGVKLQQLQRKADEEREAYRAKKREEEAAKEAELLEKLAAKASTTKKEEKQ